ncbi:methyl-accepting chemotaxis protein [Pseudoalteromonas aurantia]|nr:methyl-accepting chemotaxis protein [Pseudoalteromonas aurantia]TMO56314.1 methyl-accepting chemotaxis protein [Pseudoalteromonas aurantia]
MLIKTRLLLSFMLIGLVPAGIIALFSLLTASSALEKQAYNQLTSIKQIKHTQLTDYFNARQADLEILASEWQAAHAKKANQALKQTAQQHHSFFKTFIEKKGYYDLFVINPNGFVDYTVAKEPDYQTSLVSGPYRNSGLAILYNSVLIKRSFVLQDFSRYAPSNNEPAAFIGLPVIVNGKIETIIALQLSIDAINRIMQTRDGMGESGESYLVGDDLLMRSDSYLDPTGHSVIASFAGNVEQNGVNTVAVKKGLQGISDTEIIIDYNGNPVLSAYLPFTFSNLKWVLLAEIDESEAFAPVYKMYWAIGLIVIITLIGVAAITIMIAKSIIRPLGGEPSTMHSISERIAQGDLRQTFEHMDSQQGVYGAMARMNQSLNSMIGTIVESTSQLASTAAQTSAASSQSNASLQEQHANIEQVAFAMEQTNQSIEEVATNARAVADLSHSAEQTSSSANENLQATVIQMQKLGAAIDNAEAVIKRVEGNAQNISRVLEVIQTVTEQTNLLALNAAIEAARAGEHGRGFAVVADEVRQLAKKTQESTADIEGMINNLQSGTHQAVEEMHLSIEATKLTINAANDSATLLEDSVQQINQIAQSAEMIATAAHQQTMTTDEIKHNIKSIKQAAVDNAAGADQVSSASYELDRLSKDLKNVTESFKLAN